MMKKDKIYELLDQCIEKGTSDDLDVLYSLIESINVKQQEKAQTTYITSILKMHGELNDDKYKIRMPIQLLLNNSINIVHGGIIATLADTAMGVLVNNIIPPNKVAVTSEIKMNYIAPGSGTILECEAAIIHRGNKTYVTEARIYSDEGKLIAFSTGTFFILPIKKDNLLKK
jgi:uncharacterized protein (TIGR00369 family)